MIDENEIETERQSEAPEVESVEDTVAAAFAEAAQKLDETPENVQGNQGQGDDKPKLDASEAARILASSKKGKGKGKKVVEATELELEPGKAVEAPAERLQAPTSWKLEAKEWFNKQPREAQAELLRRTQEQEAYFTKTSQELNREKTRYSEVNQLLDYYVPRWGVNGITPGQAAAELFAMQDLLARDPKQGLTKIMQLNGVTIDDLVSYQQGGAQQTFSQQPQQTALTPEEVRRIVLETNGQMTEQQLVQQAQSEVQAVANEVNAEGTYLYPELHNPSQVERVKSFVRDLRETQPGLSWGEATKRAVQTLRIQDGRFGSPSPATSPKLSQANEIAKARSASVSLRGRGVASVPNGYQPKPNERVEDTVRATLAAMLNG